MLMQDLCLCTKQLLLLKTFYPFRNEKLIGIELFAASNQWKMMGKVVKKCKTKLRVSAAIMVLFSYLKQKRKLGGLFLAVFP